MKALVVLLMLSANSLMAASINSYDLKLDVKLNGKPIPTFNIKVKEGEKASITHKTEDNRNFIDVVATRTPMKGGDKAVLMKFIIGTIGENSKRTITASPVIIAKENESAMITQGDSKTGREIVSLSVVAKSVE